MITVGAVLLGLGVGLLTGMFGVGGGFIMTPMLNIVLGVPMPLAVGTSAMQILGVSTAGLYRRRGDGHTDYKLALVVFGGNYVGVRLGAAMLVWLGSLGEIEVRGAALPAVEFYLLWVFVVLLAGIAAWLWYDTSRSGGEEGDCPGVTAAIHLPPYSEFATLTQRRQSLVGLAYLGVGLGLVTGLLGIGGGVIVLPALIYLVGMRTHRAAATSLALVWSTSLLATITHAARGNTSLALGVPLLVGGTVGLQLGVTLSSRMRGLALRRSFCFVVLAAMLAVAAKLASFWL